MSLIYFIPSHLEGIVHVLLQSVEDVSSLGGVVFVLEVVVEDDVLVEGHVVQHHPAVPFRRHRLVPGEHDGAGRLVPGGLTGGVR